jgi:hypothetical protein
MKNDDVQAVAAALAAIGSQLAVLIVAIKHKAIIRWMKRSGRCKK